MEMICVSRTTVDRWSKCSNTTDKPRHSLNLTPQKKGVIKRVLKSIKTLRGTSVRTGVSPTTVWKTCRRSKHNNSRMFPYKHKPKLRLSLDQIEQRRLYCETYPKTESGILSKVKRTIFYDEKPMYLEKGVNKQNNRIWSDTPDTVWFDSRPSDTHPTVVHCFAGISYNEKSKLNWYGEMTTYLRGKRCGSCLFTFVSIHYRCLCLI